MPGSTVAVAVGRVPVIVGEAVAVGVSDGVAVGTVGVSVAVIDGVGLTVPVGVTVGVAEMVGVSLAVNDGPGVGVIVGVRVGVAVGELTVGVKVTQVESFRHAALYTTWHSPTQVLLVVATQNGVSHWQQSLGPGVGVRVGMGVGVGVSVTQFPDPVHRAPKTTLQPAKHRPPTGGPHAGSGHWQQSVRSFGVGVAVAVPVRLGVDIGVSVGVDVAVGVSVAVEDGDGVDVGVTVGVTGWHNPALVQRALTITIHPAASQLPGAGAAQAGPAH